MFTEACDAPVILEDYRGDPNSPHLAKIGGRFLSEGAKSRNKRVYEGIAAPLRKAQTAIDSGTVLPMRTHHAAGDNALLITGKLTKVTEDGRYEGLVPNTDAGRSALILAEGGYIKHVSLVADGQNLFESIPSESAPNKEAGWVRVKPQWELKGIDLTSTPGIDTTLGVAESTEGQTFVESFEVQQPARPQLTPEICESSLTEALTAEQLAAVLFFEREYSAAERKKAASDGAAMPDGSFPIYTAADVQNAAHLWSHSPNPKEAKAHIKQRAKEIGATSELPWDWKHDDTEESHKGDSTPMTQESVKDLLKQQVSHVTGTGKAGSGVTETTTPAPETQPVQEQAPAAVATTQTTETSRLERIEQTLESVVTALAGLVGQQASPTAGQGTATESATPTTETTATGITEETIKARIDEAVQAGIEQFKTDVLKARRKSVQVTESATEGGESDDLQGKSTRELVGEYARAKGVKAAK